MSSTKKSNFADSIRSKFNSLGAVQEAAVEKDVTEAAVENEKKAVAVEPVKTEETPAPEPKEETVVPAEEPKKEETETKTEPEKANDINFFDDAIAPNTEGFAVIKVRKTGNIIAVNLEKREEEEAILKLLENNTTALKKKKVDYAYLPKESLKIFRQEWEEKKLTIVSFPEGLSCVVKLDDTVKEAETAKTASDIDERLKEEGFLRDIEQLGEPRRTSTVLPDDLIQYCSRRASTFKIYRGPQRWLITNLLYADREKHPELK